MTATSLGSFLTEKGININYCKVPNGGYTVSLYTSSQDGCIFFYYNPAPSRPLTKLAIFADMLVFCHPDAGIGNVYYESYCWICNKIGGKDNFDYLLVIAEDYEKRYVFNR